MSSLRFFISLSILKHGLQQKHLENLKKIYVAEAFYNKETTQSVNINKLCVNLFNALKIIKPVFEFRISAMQNHNTNKNLLTLLLLTVSQYTTFCYVHTIEKHIIIRTENNSNILSPIIKALGGYCLREIITNQISIIIPAPTNDNPSVYIESEWELIFDKFSSVNIFFKNIVK